MLEIVADIRRDRQPRRIVERVGEPERQLGAADPAGQGQPGRRARAWSTVVQRHHP